jgi:hypothetical protein
VMTMEADGNHERARFCFVMLVLLGDVISHRVDPSSRITIHWRRFHSRYHTLACESRVRIGHPCPSIRW